MHSNWPCRNIFPPKEVDHCNNPCCCWLHAQLVEKWKVWVTRGRLARGATQHQDVARGSSDTDTHRRNIWHCAPPVIAAKKCQLLSIHLVHLWIKTWAAGVSSKSLHPTRMPWDIWQCASVTATKKCDSWLCCVQLDGLWLFKILFRYCCYGQLYLLIMCQSSCLRSGILSLVTS